MYTPEHFAEHRPDVLHQIMRASPLATLVTHTADGLDANHLPFEFDAQRGPLGTLSAHVARANPVWQTTADGASVLVIFQSAAQGYISPNWYPSKHVSHQQVPTWNYAVVHAHGLLRIRDDERFVRGIVARLTRTYEATQAQPWKMSDAPPDYLNGMLKAIVGIEIEITRLAGKSKLSQNKTTEDRQGAIDALNRAGQTALAGVMQATIPPGAAGA
jgi:transcriptional regulator